MKYPGYTNNSQDFTPVVLSIKKAGADIIATYMTNSPDVGVFAKQLRQLGVSAEWLGSASVVTDAAMKLAGPALHGVYGTADFTPDSSPEARSYTAKYRECYKLDPDVYSSWAHDATRLLALAIANARGAQPEAIRTAIVGIKGWKGVEGTCNFDQAGDGLRGYNVVRKDGGRVVFIKHIDFKE